MRRGENYPLAGYLTLQSRRRRSARHAGSLALISANFTGQARGRAIGTWSGFGAITAATGPLLGGWLTQHASWRDVFMINLPLTLIILVIAILRVPESKDTSRGKHIDFFGALLATAALGSTAIALSCVQAGPAARLTVPVSAAAAIFWLLFIRWETHTVTPMIPLRVFTNRAFSVANIYTFLLYTALGASMFFIPIDLQNVQGYAPQRGGCCDPAVYPHRLCPLELVRAVSSNASAYARRWSSAPY